MPFIKNCFYIAAQFLLLISAVNAQDIKVTSVSGVPTPQMATFNKQLKESLSSALTEKVSFNAAFSMGYSQKVKEIFQKEKEAKPGCILANGIQLPVLAYKNDFGIPVIQFFWNEPSKPHPNVARIIMQAPVERYCTALKECGWQGGALAIVMDEGSFFEDAQAEKLGKKYQELFAESHVEKIKVDPKTCAILMNLVSAYNMFKSKNIKAIYVSSSGNTSKIFPFILKVAKKLKIVVFTNKAEALKMGGCFALRYDEDKFIESLSSLISSELSGKHTATPIHFTDFSIICNPDNLIKYGMELPEKTAILKSDDDK